MTVHDFTYTGGDRGAPYQVQQYGRLDRVVAQVQYYFDSVRDWRQDVVNYATQVRQGRDDAIVARVEAVTARDETVTARDETVTARDEAVTARDEATDMVVNGIRGPQGLQGETGSVGPQGDTGPEGPQGPTGTLELIGGDNPAITVDTSVGTRVFVGDTMIHGDTGWRDVSYLFSNAESSTPLRLRRTHNMVTLDLYGVQPTADLGSGSSFIGALPSGFRPNFRRSFGLQVSGSSSTFRSAFQFANGAIGCWVPSTDDSYHLSLTYPTSDSWASTLPGTPA